MTTTTDPAALREIVQRQGIAGMRRSLRTANARRLFAQAWEAEVEAALLELDAEAAAGRPCHDHADLCFVFDLILAEARGDVR